MAITEVDAISNAIIETEREIAGSAFDQEDTELDETGDRSVEEMGDGLEGQHEAEDGEEVDGEEAGDDEASDAEAVEAAAAAAPGKDGKGEQPAAARTEEVQGRVPSGKLREANEALRAATAERDALKAQIEKAGGENKSLSDKFDLVMREIAELKRPRVEPKDAAEKPKRPDQFEDPDGFADHLERGIEERVAPLNEQISNLRVETSMAIAHAVHKDTFEKAWVALNQLNPQDPDARATVQRIYKSPNPGDALLNWHKRNETLARVGPDPDAFEERIRNETREALMKDPEFKKQLIAELRGEAQRPGPDGNPRTATRLPNSLARASGSNLGAERTNVRGDDDSEQAIAESAWRT